MATIRQFEDVQAWQRARELTRAIYGCTRSGTFAKDYQLRDQIRRAATSVMSNIAEGFERSGTGEFIQFLAMAKGSTAEVESFLYIALDESYITSDQFKRLRSLTTSTKGLIAGFMHYLRQSGVKGVKFKKASPDRNRRHLRLARRNSRRKRLSYTTNDKLQTTNGDW
jgi:four helix bundle protein